MIFKMKQSGVFRQMTLRDIARHFPQYISLIIIMLLASALISGFLSNHATFRKTIDDYYEAANLPDIICQFSALNTDDIDYFDGIGNAEYRIYSEGGINSRSAKIYIAPKQNIISQPVVVEGARGFLIDVRVAERDEIKLGDLIDVELPSGITQLEVSGFMHFAEVSNTYSYCPVFIDSDVYANAVGIPEAFIMQRANQALINAENFETLKNTINSRYQSLGDSRLIFVYTRETIESVVTLESELNQSIRMIYVFPVIFLLVAMLVTLTTVGALIVRERTAIGTLKGLGFSTLRITLHYASVGAVLSLAGSLAGMIIGPFIVTRVMLIKYSLVYSLPASAGIVFEPLICLAAIFLACFLSALIGFLVCYKTVREKPAECMRPEPPKSHYILNQMVKRGKSIDARGISFKMAARNVVVRPQRALMTVMGIVGCVALLVCSFGIGDTVNNSIDLELGKQFVYDINTSFSTEKAEEFVGQIEQVYKAGGQIEHYEIYKIYYMTAQAKNSKDIKVYVLPDNPQLTTINPSNGAILSQSVAADLGIKKGETLTLSAAGKTVEIVIDQIMENSFTRGIFINDGGFLDGVFYSSGMWIKTHDTDGLVDEINLINGTKNAYSMQQLRDDVSVTISSIDTIKLTMMIFAIALAVVVLYNLSLLSINERSREVATMKVLGFSNLQVGASLFIEIMALVIFGTAIGMALGYPLTILVMSINKVAVLDFIYRLRAVSYIASAAISVVTALAINLLFFYPVSKINMIESLKSIE